MNGNLHRRCVLEGSKMKWLPVWLGRPQRITQNKGGWWVMGVREVEVGWMYSRALVLECHQVWVILCSTMSGQPPVPGNGTGNSHIMEQSLLHSLSFCQGNSRASKLVPMDQIPCWTGLLLPEVACLDTEGPHIMNENGSVSSEIIFYNLLRIRILLNGSSGTSFRPNIRMH